MESIASLFTPQLAYSVWLFFSTCANDAQTLVGLVSRQQWPYCCRRLFSNQKFMSGKRREIWIKRKRQRTEDVWLQRVEKRWAHEKRATIHAHCVVSMHFDVLNTQSLVSSSLRSINATLRRSRDKFLSVYQFDFISIQYKFINRLT